MSPIRGTATGHVRVEDGIHTATFAEIGGRRYAFAARNPPIAELAIYDITDPATSGLVATVPVAANYGIHDTFVRDGIAFVFAWNTGVSSSTWGTESGGAAVGIRVEVGRW